MLFADFTQSYIEDEEANATADEVADAWTPAANAALLAPGRGFVRIGTVRPMDVPVEIRVEEAAPSLAVDQFDHVAEASVGFPTGRLVVAGNSDYWADAARITVPPGTYRVRVLMRGLDTLSADGLDGEDTYCVALWSAPEAPPRVLKRGARPLTCQGERRSTRVRGQAGGHAASPRTQASSWER